MFPGGHFLPPTSSISPFVFPTYLLSPLPLDMRSSHTRECAAGEGLSAGGTKTAESEVPSEPPGSRSVGPARGPGSPPARGGCLLAS